MSKTTEAFSRIKIDALLEDAGWTLTDGVSVLFEHTLPDGHGLTMYSVTGLVGLWRRLRPSAPALTLSRHRTKGVTTPSNSMFRSSSCRTERRCAS